MAVVASIIVDADSQWREAVSRLEMVRDKYVAVENRRNFHFHATEILKGKPPFKGEEWPIERRIEVIAEILDIIYDMKLPVSMGWSKKKIIQRKLSKSKKFEKATTDIIQANMVSHMTAFTNSIGTADAYIRQHHNGDVASVYAEDVENMRWFLESVPLLFEVMAEHNEGFSPFTHIINGVHLCKKSQAPLLQLADAAAFTWRRFIYNRDYGLFLKQRMMGNFGITFGNDVRFKDTGSLTFRNVDRG